MKFAVTGATGGLGSLALDYLVRSGQDVGNLVAIVRDPAKAARLSAQGIEVRVADYEDRAALERALAGVDRLLLVSSNTVGSRQAQHENVVAAAKAAGTGHIVYTSLAKADSNLSPLAPDHVGTEAALRASGLSHTVLRNNWYHENHVDEVARAAQLGVIPSAAGDGRVGSVSKADLAEAAARALVTPALDGRVLELSGALWNFDDLARIASRIHGKPVKFERVPAEARQAALVGAGLPEPVAAFVTGLEVSIAKGALEVESGDLEEVLGRKAETLEAGLKRLLGK